ncbi:MAG TPA: alanine--tRNA ligase, partial [Candidatus Eisenbacteria bacterium]|nr:alanine--tRNA ligase [Candidatus Eisenbacteria bacterium]
KYLEFFESKSHIRMPSFSLIPKNDPSILLVNAGMTPLKPYFTGVEKAPGPRLVTYQKCIRTQDIDIVGLTARHATFFEMLGNFSFGDYFKEEAIAWAWEFCLDVMNMPEDRLYATIYKDDDEAYDIWHDQIGLPAEKIFRFGKEDNFWEHGTGPCGPCSELFFDRGEKYGCGDPDCTVGCECDRFIEFWNLVFTQYDKDEAGNYIPLKQKNIDTGCGLERLASILQDVPTIFDIDTVEEIINATCDAAGLIYGEDKDTDIAIRVITDHIRSTVFMISDGIEPSNERRGYVLRRLIRRAARYGRKLGINDIFLTALAEVVIEQSKEAYPELEDRHDYILRVIEREEKAFARTIKQGSQILSNYISDSKRQGNKGLSGEVVFKLHDTFGFPVDLTREIAAEQHLEIDLDGFNQLMEEQKTRARKARLEHTDSAWDANALPENVILDQATEFLGYETLNAEGNLLYILQNTKTGLQSVESAGAGEPVILISDRTPFYAEAGGQIGDQGTIANDHAKVEIKSVSKNGDGIYLQSGNIISGEIQVGDQMKFSVDKKKRLATERNHTGTHILHQALFDVLGEHVEQAGSLVEPERLRFDFKHDQPVSQEELYEIEKICNQVILQDIPIKTDMMSLEQAKKSGARALFGEKYSDRVRVVSIGEFSKELCGGTHLEHSSQIASLRILNETGTAAGVRRIEAVTGLQAYQKSRQEADILHNLSEQLKVQPADLKPRLEQIQDKQKEIEKELALLRQKAAVNIVDDLLKKSENIGIFKTVMYKLDNVDADQLRQMGDQIRDHFQEQAAVVILASEYSGKVIWLIMATRKAVESGVHAGNLIREAAKLTGGGGGGRPDMAQAGGKNPDKIEDAFDLLKNKLAKL